MPHCPQQADGVNCGVFVLSILSHLLNKRAVPSTLDPTDERRRLATLLSSIDTRNHGSLNTHTKDPIPMVVALDGAASDVAKEDTIVVPENRQRQVATAAVQTKVGLHTAQDGDMTRHHATGPEVNVSTLISSVDGWMQRHLPEPNLDSRLDEACRREASLDAQLAAFEGRGRVLDSLARAMDDVGAVQAEVEAEAASKGSHPIWAGEIESKQWLEHVRHLQALIDLGQQQFPRHRIGERTAEDTRREMDEIRRDVAEMRRRKRQAESLGNLKRALEQAKEAFDV
ncbi:hypothetical protein EDB81DRAFT_374485 [Dactylonectria macrodidyma]|uniref:Ubiquitin-like protease family profile domain-containing protein n=1 Tax=Dactylonectria macrodidyma TaxID=307937 RepID=A0A9P9I6S1_9HYPO|nr:hypothetical protein EDB81DRAFT_374485 [Dactylonectria macrodidyma]